MARWRRGRVGDSDRVTVSGLFLILCSCCGLGCLIVRAWRAAGVRLPWRDAHALTPTPRYLRPLEQWAFDFERETLELTAVSPAQKALASHLLSQLIVPLIGHVRLCDVDTDLERGVASVLRAQPGSYQTDYAAELWHGFLYWSRCRAGPAQEPTVWHPLIAEIEHRYRQCRDEG